MTEAAPGRSEELRTKVFGERAVYDNFWVRVTLVDIQTPDGERFEHHVVRLKTVAIAAVVDERDRVLMLWRYRFVTDEWGWELPGGISEAGEDAGVTAAREVLEETGWRPAPLQHLFTFQPMPGMVDTPHALFVGSAAPRRLPSRRIWRRPASSTGFRCPGCGSSSSGARCWAPGRWWRCSTCCQAESRRRRRRSRTSRVGR